MTDFILQALMILNQLAIVEDKGTIIIFITWVENEPSGTKKKIRTAEPRACLSPCSSHTENLILTNFLTLWTICM